MVPASDNTNQGMLPRLSWQWWWRWKHSTISIPPILRIDSCGWSERKKSKPIVWLWSLVSVTINSTPSWSDTYNLQLWFQTLLLALLQIKSVLQTFLSKDPVLSLCSSWGVIMFSDVSLLLIYTIKIIFHNVDRGYGAIKSQFWLLLQCLYHLWIFLGEMVWRNDIKFNKTIWHQFDRL